MTEEKEAWEQMHDLHTAWMAILDDVRIDSETARRIVLEEIKRELQRQ